MNVGWHSPLSSLGGKKATQVVNQTGIETVSELLRRYPRNYVAKGSLSDLGELVEGDLLSLVGEVVSATQHTWLDKRTHRTAYRLEVVVRGEDGSLLLTFFDRHKKTADWRVRDLAPGQVGMFSGRLKLFNGRWQLVNPDSRTYGARNASGMHAEMPDLVPIYPSAGKLNSWRFEELVALALDLVDDVPDPVPPGLRESRGLITAAEALRWIHRPDTRAQITKATQRLKFEEAFVAQCVLARRRAAASDSPATPRVRVAGGLLDRFDDDLPFELTAGQRAVGAELATELAGTHRMHRLLQGDVGAGKTLVALRAMLQVVDAGGQAALLAPTEVLAQQHLRSIETMLGGLGRGGELGAEEGATRVALLTGSLGAAARREALGAAADGEAGIVVGTHALLEDKVAFADLGLVVIDEQHRFGVEQRAVLADREGTPPHVLVMTATPIPRTVAMTVFGDLDTSTLPDLPPGRGEVQTSVVPLAARPTWLDRAWQRIREEVDAGRQAYVVCPRIGDEPPPEGEDGPTTAAVEEVVDDLADGILDGLRVRKLHGRMTPDDKDRTMREFSAGEIDVLVSTTVIEVGVDVPNATVMVVLDADRFGVSQLHQLRGRIGRGGHAGLCLLVSHADPDGSSMARLVAVAATGDGFELSRIDLEQRREGDLLGKDQSGRSHTLRLLSVLKDEDVIADARDAAIALLAADPALSSWQPLHDTVAGIEASGQADFLERG